MGNIDKNNTFRWVSKVIDSCQTSDQLKVAKQLVINFYKQLPPQDKTTTISIILGAKLEKKSSLLYKTNKK